MWWTAAAAPLTRASARMLGGGREVGLVVGSFDVLPRTAWRLCRRVRGGAGGREQLARTFLLPFPHAQIL